MKYRVRTGVVVAEVCDEYLLVSTGESRGKVPYVKSLNSTGAWFWRQLEENGDADRIISAAMAEYGITQETARSAFESFTAALMKDGYVLAE